METYIIHRTDGTVKVIRQKRVATLKQLQGWVGGYIERVKMGNVDFICNEDGYALNLTTNPYFPGFVGNIVICEDRNGHFYGVSDQYLKNPYYSPVEGLEQYLKEKKKCIH